MNMSDGKPMECWAAMISRIPGSIWLEGKLIETVKNWQEEWFYMAYVCQDGIHTPFTTASLERLHSWTPKNIVWEEAEELIKIMARVKHFVDKKVTMIDVMHVARYRGVQPLQARAHPMWEFTGEGDETSVIRGFYGKRTIAAMQTLLFTSKDQFFRAEGADIGYPGQGSRTYSSSCCAAFHDANFNKVLS
jgi:hypothetical protein